MLRIQCYYEFPVGWLLTWRMWKKEKNHLELPTFHIIVTRMNDILNPWNAFFSHLVYLSCECTRTHDKRRSFSTHRAKGHNKSSSHALRAQQSIFSHFFCVIRDSCCDAIEERKRDSRDQRRQINKMRNREWASSSDWWCSQCSWNRVIQA